MLRRSVLGTYRPERAGIGLDEAAAGRAVMAGTRPRTMAAFGPADSAGIRALSGLAGLPAAAKAFAGS